jgi:hypothetical protein
MLPRIATLLDQVEHRRHMPCNMAQSVLLSCAGVLAMS